MKRDAARRLGRVAPLPVMVLAALLSGCTKPDTSPIRNDLPRPSGSPPSERPLPPAKGKWTGLKAKCPTLDSAAARSLGVTGEGRPTPEYHTYEKNVIADCQWGSEDGRGTAVKVRLEVWESQQASDAGWRIVSAGQTQLLPGVGDEAFSTLEPPNATVRVRTNNAVAIVRIAVPDPVGGDKDALMQRLHQVQPSAEGVTRDVLDDLR
jgi:hypothetical protein